MKKISNIAKYSYSIGATGRDVNFVLVTMFVLVYIQYTMNLTVTQFSAISVVMIIARIWDAINDPMIGMLIENKPLRGTRYRNWLLLGGFINFISVLLMFTVRPEGWYFVIFFAIVYISWGMTYTVNDVSYYSLLLNLTNSNETRNSLTNLTQLFGSLGQFIAGAVIPILVTGNAIFMYRVVGVIISFVFMISMIITYFGVSENEVKEEKKGKITLRRMMSIIKNNDQLLVSALSFMLFITAHQLFMIFAMNFFYLNFGYGGENVLIFSVTFAIGTLIALGSFAFLNKKYARMDIMKIALVGVIVGYLLFLSLGTIIPMIKPLLFFSTLLVCFGNSLFLLINVIFIANTAEYNLVKFGEKNVAIIACIRPFMAKIGAALHQVIYSFVLILSGVYSYSQAIAELEIKKNMGEVSDIVNQANDILLQATPFMKFSMKIGMAVIPLLLTLIAAFVLKRKYVITEEKFTEYVKYIETSDKNNLA